MGVRSEGVTREREKLFSFTIKCFKSKIIFMLAMILPPINVAFYVADLTHCKVFQVGFVSTIQNQ
jgi:hypothetical protein